ncbi:MAG: ABC transporter ATP-binding protein [Bacteroidetes bacterium 4572_114]|nr:MAG: ABC transporter ATP-binding protein [Bacteroidetes bacterium 4572_114]
MIEVINVSKSFDGQMVLKDITTTFEKGKTNLIIGQSGSGKTVLMKCCIGLLDADEGEIIFDGLVFSALKEKEKRKTRKEMGVLFQIVNANEKFPSEISGGMIKRVAIARAIALNPKYLFCDEPNSGLDPKTAERIDQLISELTEKFQMITVINTHDMNSVLQIGEKIAFIHSGQLWWEGDKNQILNTDNEELNEFVFATELTRRVKR